MEGEKRKTEEGRERFDLDVWPQQPAGDGDTRVKERKTDRGGGGGGGGGSKVLG